MNKDPQSDYNAPQDPIGSGYSEQNSVEESLNQASSESDFYVPKSYDKERALIESIKIECGKVLIGQDDLIDKMLICLIADGHVLLEGVPGIAKTLSARVFANVLSIPFNRIQFTPDLMPADIIGTSIFNIKESEFSFVKGPIFSSLILIDEINRAPAKTQSALFEVMEEKQISFDGEKYEMAYPFIIIATQNPIEQEGTYRLPEAQLDRFMMKLILDYPSPSEELQILQRFKQDVGKADLSEIEALLNPESIKVLSKTAAEVVISDQMLKYITDIIVETRNNGKLYIGGSPRASLAIMRCSKVVALMAGRSYVIPDDIQWVAPDILNHRLIMNSNAEIVGDTTHLIIQEIIQEIEVPR